VKTTLSMLVHGESGVGKSWFADTAPAPRLIVDLEGRARYTPSAPKVGWDPRTQAPPEAGDWATCVASCPDFETLQHVYQWLRSGQHCFRSVVVDSLMEAQKRCIDSEVPDLRQLHQQDWGTLLRKVEAEVRRYRDLTLIESNPVEVVVFLVGTVDAEGVRRPLLQGQLRQTVPYYLDVVGYLYVTAGEDGSMQRGLLLHPQPNFVAKEGTGRLGGPVVLNPDLSQMVELLRMNGQATAPTEAQEVSQ
jgi:hypothetical protein